ncbi:DUF1573 domain-containing protein [Flavobacteriales bacterium]|jgi:hypothetical protein|nr:DUF1573 domain-containing protein [Flavobacteriales bacterium]
MNDKSNIAIAISLVAFFISLYSLTSKTDNEDIFIKSPNKTYISPDPATKRNVDNIEKNMRENPFTPTMDGASKLPKTAIKFATDLHEFGNVDVNSENKYSFSFKNSGSEPLKISNAKGSCGCTVPNWPKEPILPGESSEIEVVFRPSKGQAGSKQTKTVTVSANTSPENTILKITAFVNKTSE